MLIGLSGGKDSIILAHALASRKHVIPFDYKIFAAHVRVKNLKNEVDIDFLRSFCENLNIEFHLIEIEVDFEKDKRISPCFVCSWNRRAELFKLTNTLNCNKLALGHHLGDAAETLIMNMVYNAEISSMPYKVSMFKGRFEIIRPMLDIEEEKLVKYADLMNFHGKETKKCPFGDNSKRETVKKLIENLQEHNKNAKRNIYKSMFKIIPEYLPK